MYSLILGKRHRGAYAHTPSTTLLDASGKSCPMNAMFADPSAMMAALKRSGQCTIASGEQDAPLVQAMLPGGPMAKEFTKDEVEVVRRWIKSGAPLIADQSEGASSEGNDVRINANAHFKFTL